MLDEAGYDGVVSSHTWSDDTIYPRVVQTGGVVTPYAGSAEYFVEPVAQAHEGWAPRSATSTAASATARTPTASARRAGPRGADAPNPVTYPFTGLGGVASTSRSAASGSTTSTSTASPTTASTRTGSRTCAASPGTPIVRDLERGPEAYLQTWERVARRAGAAAATTGRS